MVVQYITNIVHEFAKSIWLPGRFRVHQLDTQIDALAPLTVDLINYSLHLPQTTRTADPYTWRTVFHPHQGLCHSYDSPDNLQKTYLPKENTEKLVIRWKDIHSCARDFGMELEYDKQPQNNKGFWRLGLLVCNSFSITTGDIKHHNS